MTLDAEGQDGRDAIRRWRLKSGNPVNAFDGVFFMWKKRAVFFISVTAAIFCLFIARLAQIQIISPEHFSKRNINLYEASVSQRTQELEIDSGRGGFVDRSGRPLIYEKMRVLVLFPFLKHMNWNVGEIANIIGESPLVLSGEVERAREPFIYGEPSPLLLTEEQMKKINNLGIPGVFAVEKKVPKAGYDAEHLIGITGENDKLLKSRYPEKVLPAHTPVGLTGLQKSFDAFLLGEGAARLVYHVDGLGRPLFGPNVKYVGPANPFYPVNVKTTLDGDYQDLAEKLVDKHKIAKGGLILLDMETNSILASVSRPRINKMDPFDSEKGEIKNMMVTEHIPGSVFKTVIAAAAIDYHLDDPTRLFDCSTTIHGKPDPKYRHGMLNFSDSFARSCNNTFATLANELRQIDENIIETYAKKLSLIGRNVWHGDIFYLKDFQQLPDEDSGRVYLDRRAKKDKNFTAMTAIGQHEVRVTPLAVANMMATIARGGQKELVRAVFSVEYKNGVSLVSFDKRKHPEESVSPYTAIKLQKLLREVVTNEKGTGRWLRNLPYEVAGKSGTAETGTFSEQGYPSQNKWFAGYFPYKNPKYVLVTVRLDAPENEGGVIRLFADMVKEIYSMEQRRESS